MSIDKIFKDMKMSNAEVRNGKRVWKALHALWSRGEYLMTVGEVAEEVDMSRPAVKKYLEILVSSDHLRKFSKGKKTAYYTFLKVA